MAAEDNFDDLICPILMDLLEDPIICPVCGRAISRAPFIVFHQLNQKCPVCTADLPHYNPTTAPKSINLAYLVEEAKKKGLRRNLARDEN